MQVFVEAEDSVRQGLQPGSGGDRIVDGWTVTYQKFLVAVGNFRATRSQASGDRLADGRVFVVDLKALPTGGLVLFDFARAAAVRWDRVGYDMPDASPAAECAPGVSQADCELMKQSGYSLYIDAALTKPDGQSCRPSAPTDCVPRSTLRIRWGVRAGTAFDDCAPPQGDAGFAVPAGGAAQVKLTVHGDHWFFTNITQGAEVTERRAQWIADSDLDRDGETTLDELRNVRASDLFPSPRYNLSGALGGPIATAFDYFMAQARTLADFQGEGECPTRRILP